jgi:Calcineurin-like phosphoesterase
MHFSNARGIHANGLYMRKALMLICILQWNLPGQSQPQLPTVAENGPGLSFVEWSNACTRLPSNRALGERMPPKSLLPLSGFGELDSALSDFFQQCKHGSLGQTNLWLGERPSANAFFNTETAYFLEPTVSASAFVESFVPRPRNPQAAPPFQPFAAKLRVNEGAEIFFHADLHGDIRSLMGDLAWLNREGYLDAFKIAKPNFYMVLLGDYADRGRYGVEVLYTLLRLKLANPDRVFLLRGNHEEISIAARYGFLSEGIIKYGSAFNVQKVARAYDFLPVVLYVGTAGNFIQCQHGGMEPGFDPRALLDSPGELAFQLLGALNQRQFLEAHPEWISPWTDAPGNLIQKVLQDFRPEDPISPAVLGFMWNDFSVLANEPEFSIDPGRAYVYGPQATRFLLKQARTQRSVLQAVFRGHQQSALPNPLMNRLLASHGIFRHWQDAESAPEFGSSIAELAKHLETGAIRVVPPGSVWTFNVGPDSVYGEGNHYTFDSFGILNTAKNFADWRLRVVNVEIRL